MRQPPKTVDVVDLLATVLDSSPALPGSLCRGRSDVFDVFDAEDDEQLAQAVRICQRCPALDACQDWAATLPDNVVSGVIAGRLFIWSQRSMGRSQPVAS
jgi:hypothetical protein